MAIIVNDQLTKAKLVFQREDSSGTVKQSSRTFSNLVTGLGNEALYAGMTALAGLLDVTVEKIVRLDENTIINE